MKVQLSLRQPANKAGGHGLIVKTKHVLGKVQRTIAPGSCGSLDYPVRPLENQMSVMAILQQLTALACDKSRNKRGVTPPCSTRYGVFLVIDSSQFTIAACIAIR